MVREMESTPDDRVASAGGFREGLRRLPIVPILLLLTASIALVGAAILVLRS
jgi:hypothetical protein